MPHYRRYFDDRSEYPGRGSVNWTGPSDLPYRTREYAPSDSSGLDPTSFRRNAFAAEQYGRRAPGREHPEDYSHYRNRSYNYRDPGHTSCGMDNYGSEDRYAGYGGGDKLSRDAASLRGGSGLGSISSSASSYVVRRDSRLSSPPRSRSRFDDFMGSSSSGRHHRDRSYDPYKYFGPDDIGRSSSSSRRADPYKYFFLDDIGRSSSSGRPSMSYGRYESQGGYGSSGAYQTRIVTPEGLAMGGFVSTAASPSIEATKVEWRQRV